MNRLLLASARALLSFLTPRPSGARGGRARTWARLLTAVAVVGVLTARLLSGPAEPTAADSVEAEKNGRAILGRAWFDRLPEKSRDSFHLWFWFGGGIGIHESGSRYRFTLDLFDFERKGSTVDMRYFHDGKRVESGFKVEKCDDLPPFDLCLTFDKAPGDGPKKLYGFDYDDDLDQNVPWAAQARRAAEEQARAPRP